MSITFSDVDVELPGMPPTPDPATFEPAPDPAPDVAPKRRRGRPPKAAADGQPAAPRDRAPRSRTAPAIQKSRKQIVDALDQCHQLGAVGLGMAGMPETAAALAAAGPAAAPILAPMVEKNPWLLKLLTTGENGAAMLQLIMVYYAVYQAGIAERAAITAAKQAGEKYQPVVPTS